MGDWRTLDRLRELEALSAKLHGLEGCDLPQGLVRLLRAQWLPECAEDLASSVLSTPELDPVIRLSLYGEALGAACTRIPQPMPAYRGPFDKRRFARFLENVARPWQARTISALQLCGDAVEALPEGTYGHGAALRGYTRAMREFATLHRASPIDQRMLKDYETRTTYYGTLDDEFAAGWNVLAEILPRYSAEFARQGNYGYAREVSSFEYGFARESPLSRLALPLVPVVLDTLEQRIAYRSSSPGFLPLERGLFVLLASNLQRWREATLLVKPDTVLRWHGEGFRLLWKRRSKAGRDEDAHSCIMRFLFAPLCWEGDQASFEAAVEAQYEFFVEHSGLRGCGDHIWREVIDISELNIDCSQYLSANECGGELNEFLNEIEGARNTDSFDVVMALTNQDICGSTAGNSSMYMIWAESNLEIALTHELGHILGLDDEYCSSDLGGGPAAPVAVRPQSTSTQNSGVTSPIPSSRPSWGGTPWAGSSLSRRSAALSAAETRSAAWAMRTIPEAAASCPPRMLPVPGGSANIAWTTCSWRPSRAPKARRMARFPSAVTSSIWARAMAHSLATSRIWMVECESRTSRYGHVVSGLLEWVPRGAIASILSTLLEWCCKATHSTSTSGLLGQSTMEWTTLVMRLIACSPSRDYPLRRA